MTSYELNAALKPLCDFDMRIIFQTSDVPTYETTKLQSAHSLVIEPWIIFSHAGNNSSCIFDAQESVQQSTSIVQAKSSFV